MMRKLRTRLAFGMVLVPIATLFTMAVMGNVVGQEKLETYTSEGGVGEW